MSLFDSLGKQYEKPYILQYAEKLVQELKGVVNMQYGNLDQTPARSIDEKKKCITMSNLFIVFREEIKEILDIKGFEGIDFGW